ENQPLTRRQLFECSLQVSGSCRCDLTTTSQELQQSASDYSIHPEVERRLETIIAHLAVGLQQGSLKHVASLALGTCDSQCQCQNRTVIVAGKLRERFPLSCLCFPDQHCVVRHISEAGMVRARSRRGRCSRP